MAYACQLSATARAGSPRFGGPGTLEAPQAATATEDDREFPQELCFETMTHFDRETMIRSRLCLRGRARFAFTMSDAHFSASGNRSSSALAGRTIGGGQPIGNNTVRPGVRSAVDEPPPWRPVCARLLPLNLSDSRAASHDRRIAQVGSSSPSKRAHRHMGSYI